MSSSEAPPEGQPKESVAEAGLGAFAELFRLLAITPRPKWATPALIGMGLLASLLETAGIYLIILFLHSATGDITSIVSHFGGFGEALVAQFGQGGTALLIAVVIFGLIVGRAMISWRYDLLGQHVSEQIAEAARNKLHRQFMRVSYEWVTSHEQATLIETLQRDSWMVSGAYIALTKIVISVCSLVVFTIVLLFLSWEIALIAGIGSVMITAVVRLMSRRTKDLGDEVKDLQGNLGQQMLTSIEGMRTIRAYGQERYHEAHFEALSKRTKLASLKLHGTTASLDPISDIGYLGILCAILGIASLGESLIATGIFAVILLFRMQPYVTLLANNILLIIRIQPQVRSVRSMMEETGKSYPPEGSIEISELKSEIRFDNVSLQYIAAANLALEDVTFTVPIGKTTALVGTSGAGKSSVVNLLLRLYEPTVGRILVDGVPLSELNRESWLHQVAVAGQDVNLIEGRIIENIRLADSEATDEEVAEAARAAGVSEFVEPLSKGYQTWIGQQGMNFSGGQRQRIGIARAMLRDPNLLILDEAMSALDRTREEQIRAAIRSRFAGRTVLLITHRLESVLTADHVVCLHKGRVVAEGSPDVLMKAESSILKQWMDADVQSNEDGDVPAKAKAAE